MKKWSSVAILLLSFSFTHAQFYVDYGFGFNFWQSAVFETGKPNNSSANYELSTWSPMKAIGRMTLKEQKAAGFSPFNFPAFYLHLNFEEACSIKEKSFDLKTGISFPEPQNISVRVDHLDKTSFINLPNVQWRIPFVLSRTKQWKPFFKSGIDYKQGFGYGFQLGLTPGDHNYNSMDTLGYAINSANEPSQLSVNANWHFRSRAQLYAHIEHSLAFDLTTSHRASIKTKRKFRGVELRLNSSYSFGVFRTSRIDLTFNDGTSTQLFRLNTRGSNLQVGLSFRPIRA